MSRTFTTATTTTRSPQNHPRGVDSAGAGVGEWAVSAVRELAEEPVAENAAPSEANTANLRCAALRDNGSPFASGATRLREQLLHFIDLSLLPRDDRVSELLDL